MPGKLGSLTVSLALDYAAFTQGMTKAEVQATAFASRLKRDVNDAIRSTTVAFGAMGLAGGAAFAFINNQASTITSFKRLSQEIGDSAVAVAGLNTVSATSGVALDSVAAASVKLTKNLASTDDTGTAAGKAIAALGLNLAQFKSLSPVDQLDAAAKALDRFQDGAGKTAVAVALFGKAGAQLLPFLHDLADAQDHNSALTQAQIDASEKFTKALATLKSQTEDAIQVFVAGFLPALTEFIKEMGDGIKIAGGFAAALLDFGSINPFNNLDQNIKDVKDHIATLQDFKTGKSFTLTQALGLDTVSGQLDTANKQLQFLLNQKARLEATQFNTGNRQNADRASAKPVLHLDTSTTGADVSKNVLAGQLKAQEDIIKSEQELLTQREGFLSSYYAADQISLRDYFTARQVVIDDAFGKEAAAYDAEIAILKAFAAKANPVERVDAENKLADAVAKRARLQQDTGAKTIQNWLDEQQAVRQLKDTIEQTSIALAAMRGDTVSAAAAQFDFANRKLQSQLDGLKSSANPDDQSLGAIGQKTLDDTRQLVILRASLTKSTDDYSLSLDRMGIEQSAIDTASASGAIGEIAALREKSDLAAKYVPILQAQLTAMEAIAAASNNPADIVHVQQLKAQLEALAATGDLVAKKFNDIGSGAFSTFLTDLVDGTKTAKQAFLDLAKTIDQQISKIFADQISQSLFKPGGAFGGFGDFFSKFAGNGSIGGAGLLTGGAAAGGAVAADASLTTLSATTLVTDTSFTTVTASALALSAALDAAAASSAVGGLSGGSGGFGAIAGSLFDSSGWGVGFGGLAGGTDNWRGGLTMVGEAGPELVNLPKGAQVMPSDKTRAMMGRAQPVIHVNVMPGVDSRTVDQAYAGTMKALQRAQRIT